MRSVSLQTKGFPDSAFFAFMIAFLHSVQASSIVIRNAWFEAFRNAFLATVSLRLMRGLRVVVMIEHVGACF